MVACNDPNRALWARTVAIVTCHDRLRHLRETLPRMADGFEVLVVDYECPDRSAEWVERWAAGKLDGIPRPHVRAVRVARDPEGPEFWKAAALNAGAQWALAHAFDRVLFLDADTIVFSPGEVARELAELGADRFLLTGRTNGYDRPGLTGILGAHVADVARVEGFDRMYRGWGVEDVDMRLQLRQLGRLPQWCAPRFFATIKHDDRSRVIHTAPRDTCQVSWARSRAQFLLKWSDRLGCELLRGRDFPPEFRELLFHNASTGGPL